MDWPALIPGGPTVSVAEVDVVLDEPLAALPA
jgi:hypothetical protein